MKLDLYALCQQYDFTPGGIIHVGAYEGKDLKRYPTPDIAKILLIEANPAAVEQLQVNYGNKPNVLIAHSAIANQDNTVTLNLASIESSSSILPLSGYQEIYPNLKVTQQITVPVHSLDTLLSELNLRPEDFNFLYLDIQGAELLALQGASQLLNSIEAIYTTVSYEDLFEGGSLIDQVSAMLAEHHFVCVAETSPYHPAWGEAFYIREHQTPINNESQPNSEEVTPSVVEEMVTLAQLQETQQELADLQSRYPKILQTLEQSQAQQQQTQQELEKTQNQLKTAQTQQQQTQQELEKTQNQLKTAQTQQQQTQQELDTSRSELHQTREELELTQFQLDEIQVELEQSQSQLYRTQEELQETQNQLAQVKLENHSQASSSTHTVAHVKMLAQILAETLPER
ncbi:MAG: FkbM family methyltransferase [Cyanobacteria bacterium J06592_8]